MFVSIGLKLELDESLHRWKETWQTQAISSQLCCLRLSKFKFTHKQSDTGRVASAAFSQSWA